MRRCAFVLVLLIATGSAVAEECALVGRYENDTVSVFRTGDGLVTFRANVDVNTDGALQSYKIDDLGFLQNSRIQTNSALNTICNGVNIRRPDDTLLFGASQCVALIDEFKRIRAFDWLKPGENYVEFYGIARVPGTEQPGKSKGKPCEKDGFYVSQVARAMDSSKSVCDPEHWVDALRIPAIVLPLDSRMKAAGVQLHDLVIVRVSNPDRMVGAIVGDTNPSRIGEATVITNMRLKGMTAIPANYRATIALAIPSAQYIVFPGTKTSMSGLSNASDAEIQAKAQQLFNQFRLDERRALCE